MLPTTVTHYFPWDENDTFAVCGHRLGAHDTHATQPTCPACAAHLAALDAAIEDTPLVLDADEARTELASATTLADEVFALGVSLNRVYAQHFPPEARLFSGRRRR